MSSCIISAGYVTGWCGPVPMVGTRRGTAARCVDGTPPTPTSPEGPRRELGRRPVGVSRRGLYLEHAGPAHHQHDDDHDGHRRHRWPILYFSSRRTRACSSSTAAQGHGDGRQGLHQGRPSLWRRLELPFCRTGSQRDGDRHAARPTVGARLGANPRWKAEVTCSSVMPCTSVGGQYLSEETGGGLLAGFSWEQLVRLKFQV